MKLYTHWNKVIHSVAIDMVDYMRRYSVNLEDAIADYDQPLNAQERAEVRECASAMLQSETNKANQMMPQLELNNYDTTEEREAMQTALDAAVEQMQSQDWLKSMEIAITGVELCRYEGPNGQGCAFRPAIAHYDDDMEGRDASDLISMYPDNLHEWALNLPADFASALQNCHDGGDTPERMQANFAEMANEFHLRLNYSPAQFKKGN